MSTASRRQIRKNAAKTLVGYEYRRVGESDRKKYDRLFVAMNEAKPLTARDKKLFARARRRGRPQIGDGADRVLISIERQLLKRVDAYAIVHGLKRSELIAKALARMFDVDSKYLGLNKDGLRS